MENIMLNEVSQKKNIVLYHFIQKNQMRDCNCLNGCCLGHSAPKDSEGKEKEQGGGGEREL